MTLEGLMGRVESRIRGRVDEYIVLVARTRSVMTKFARGKITVTQNWSSTGINVYLAKDKRISAIELGPSRLEEMVDRSLSLLDRLSESPLYSELPDPGGSSMDNVDPKIEKLLDEGLGEIAASTGLVGEADTSGMIEAGLVELRLAGSNGASYSHRLTYFQGYVRTFNDLRSGQWSWASTRLDEEAASRALRKSAELANTCRTLPSVRLESGRYRILLSPMVAGNLLSYVASAATGGSVLMGMSFLAGKNRGDRIASDVLTLKSVPGNTEMPDARSFDDEGSKPLDVEIISRGEFSTLLHNSKTAKILGHDNTGNAGWILPQVFNLEVEGGDINEDDLFDALDSGVYLTNNWYTRMQNHLEGSFSTVIRDAIIVVKRGRPVGCLSDVRVRLTGTLPALLESIEGLGKDRFVIKWWEVPKSILLPHVLLREDERLVLRVSA